MNYPVNHNLHPFNVYNQNRFDMTYLDIYVSTGTDFEFTFDVSEFIEPEDDQLDGSWTIETVYSQSRYSKVKQNFSTEILNSREIKISLQDSQTVNLKYNKYVYSVFLVKDYAKRTLISEGVMQVNQIVTPNRQNGGI